MPKEQALHSLIGTTELPTEPGRPAYAAAELAIDTTEHQVVLVSCRATTQPAHGTLEWTLSIGRPPTDLPDVTRKALWDNRGGYCLEDLLDQGLVQMVDLEDGEELRWAFSYDITEHYEADTEGWSRTGTGWSKPKITKVTLRPTQYNQRITERDLTVAMTNTQRWHAQAIFAVVRNSSWARSIEDTHVIKSALGRIAEAEEAVEIAKERYERAEARLRAAEALSDRILAEVNAAQAMLETALEQAT